MSSVNFTNVRSAASWCHITNASQTGCRLKVQSWSSDHILTHFS